MKDIKILANTLVVAMALSIFTGCGGSSGGSGSGGDGSSGGGDLSFPSSSILAEPTLENGQKVEDAVAINHAKMVSNLNSVNKNSKMSIVYLSNIISRKLITYTRDIDNKSYSLNKVIDKTENCLHNGTRKYKGNISEGASGQVTMIANECDDGDIKLNGSILMNFSNYDNDVDDFKDKSIKFITDVEANILSENLISKIYKNSYLNISNAQYDNSRNLKSYKLTTSIQTSYGAYKDGLENCIFYCFPDGDKMAIYQTQGKVYINNLTSYVIYNTDYDMSQTPFYFISLSDYANNVLSSGEARYKMADNGKLIIKVEIVGLGLSMFDAITYIDADGDGVYELSE